MRLFVGSLIVMASFSAAAAPVTECQRHFVDDAYHVTVDRSVVDSGTKMARFETTMEVKTINLNTDEAILETSPVAGIVQDQTIVYSTNKYSLAVGLTGQNAYRPDGTVMTFSKGKLTKTFWNGKTQNILMDCTSYDRW
jgi:hypothetical protein